MNEDAFIHGPLNATANDELQLACTNGFSIKQFATLRASQSSFSPIIECEITQEALSAYGSGVIGGRAFLFVDDRMWCLHAQRICIQFESVYKEVHVVPLRADEQHKNWAAFGAVLSTMNEHHVDRRCDAVYAIGGGVVLDLVGFAASTYRRGIPLTKIPTTLLAQVDAAIGLKNAINFECAKNLVGSFAAPHSVLIDRLFLKTLGLRHVANGISEIIKLGLMVDRQLLLDLMRLDPRAAPTSDAHHSIYRLAVHRMVGELNANPYEHSLQRAVDFGHWLSPVLEMEDCQILHGEAVAIDMALTLSVSLQRGLLKWDDWDIAMNLLFSWRLPWTHKVISHDVVHKALARVMEHRGGKQNIPLCIGVGRHAFYDDLRTEEVLCAHAIMCENVPHRSWYFDHDYQSQPIHLEIPQSSFTERVVSK